MANRPTVVRCCLMRSESLYRAFFGTAADVVHNASVRAGREGESQVRQILIFWRREPAAVEAMNLSLVAGRPLR